MGHETAQRETPGMYQSQRLLADILRRHWHGRPQTDPLAARDATMRRPMGSVSVSSAAMLPPAAMANVRPPR